MKHSFNLIASGLCMALLVSCFNNDSDDESSSVNLKIKSTSLEAARGVRSRAACSMTVDSATDNGYCYTPYSVSAYISKASLSSSTGGPPVRVLGGGDAYSGFDEIFRHNLMDLRQVPDIDSDDNIQDGVSASYNLVSFDVRAMETVFIATAADKYFHVRHFFVDQPAMGGSEYSSCGMTDSEEALVDSKAQLWTGFTSVRRGDLLVCIKATEDETCAAGDYQWVDSNGDLQSARPGSPKQITGTYLLSDTSCSVSGETTSLEWGYAQLMFNLNDAISITAAINGGTKTYTSGGSSGTQMTFTVDIDTANSLYATQASGLSNLATATEAEVLDDIENLMLKPIYVEKTKSNASSTNSTGVNATVTVSLQ